jgi:pyruvate dehydrogenase E1 component beta subunit
MVIENMPIYWTKGEAPSPGQRVPIGQAKVVQPGSDITLVSYSRALKECLGAGAQLAEMGISAEIIDLRSIQPWDEATVLASVERTGRCAIVHEAVVPFGAGAEIAAVIHQKLFGRLKAPVARIGAPFNPVPFAKPLETAHIPTSQRIGEAVKKVMEGEVLADRMP